MKKNPLVILVIFSAGILLAACSSAKASPMFADPEQMAIFDGTVFVATTQIEVDLWEQAGWNVSDRTINTTENSVPVDCTLYQHHGVANQWVGRCSGRVLIPKNGAKDIAVMLTQEDGSQTMIQVAPNPAGP